MYLLHFTLKLIKLMKVPNIYLCLLLDSLFNPVFTFSAKKLPYGIIIQYLINNILYIIILINKWFILFTRVTPVNKKINPYY